MNAKLPVGLASLALIASLAACLPPAAGLPRATDGETATPGLPIDGAASEPEGTTEPTPQSSERFAVTKPEIRDRMYDWEYMVTPAFDAFDAATTPSTMRAAAIEILGISKDQEQWFVKYTDYDPRYKVPISLWRDAVGLMPRAPQASCEGWIAATSH